jgi:hypothetical protein
MINQKLLEVTQEEKVVISLKREKRSYIGQTLKKELINMAIKEIVQ